MALGLSALLIHHVVVFPGIKDCKLTDQPPIISVLTSSTNLLFVIALGIGYGKPYSALAASIVGFGFLFIAAVLCAKLYDWTERMCWLLTSLTIIGEFFYNGLKHGRDQNNEH